MIEVYTQSDLDKALESHPDELIICLGSGKFILSGSAQVRAYDSAQVTAYGSAQVRASKYVAVTKDRGHRGRVDGGVVIELPAITSAEEWCEFYGVEVVDGVATLFKAVDDDFKSGYGFAYTPGTAPEAPDWDGGKAECGGGLHFSPLPFLAAGFHREATRYVACPVSLEDIAVHEDAVHPSKVKARRVCAPCYECDIDGEALECAEKSA